MKLTLILLTLSCFPSFAQVVEPPDVKLPEPDKSFNRVEFISCDARFPHGMDSLKSYIHAIWDYIPESWADSNYNKRGYFVFVVEIDSTITNVEMIRSISPEADALIIEYFQKMPKWVPACHKNGPVRSRNRMPITFVRSEE